MLLNYHDCLISSLESITYGDILTVLPFGNTADIIEIKGKHLLHVLEHSVTEYSETNPSGRFMQYSGKHTLFIIGSLYIEQGSN